MPRVKRDKPVTALAEAVTARTAEQLSFADMGVFMDAETRLSLKDAAQYCNRSNQTIKNAISQYPEIFSGAVRELQIAGMDFPPVVYINKSALDAYVTARDAKQATTHTGGRNSAAGRKYLIRVQPSQLEAVSVALSAFGINPELAFKGKPKAAQNGSGEDTVVSEQAALEPELELIEA